VLLLLLATYSINYTSAAGCGLAVKDRPDSPDQFETKSMRKEKLPVDIVNLPTGCEEGDTIDVQLPNGKVKTFKKSTGIRRNKRLNGETEDGLLQFHGESEDGSSFQYIRNKDNTIFGSLVDVSDQTVSKFRLDAFGNQVVDTIPTNDFPPEADPIHDERMLLKADESISTTSTSSFLRSNGPTKAQSSEARDLLNDLGGNLDVLVVWTSNAECRNSGLATGCTRTATTAGNMRSLINLAVTETNTAYDLSGVDTQLNLVHATHVGAYTEVSGDAFSQALNHITSTTDGVIDHVHTLREQYGADLVAMIIDDAQYCGLAWLGPSKGSMFSVTAWNCATGYYSFGHEIGHNLGCNHDKGTKGACSDSNYNYGWRDPNANFRSILAYNCKSGQCDNNAGGGCTRVQRFSNPNFLYNGSPIGNAQHDNARRINDVKATVAAYFPHKTTIASITCSGIRRRKCIQRSGCGWKSRKCLVCSSITRKRKCRLTRGCSWSGGRCS
jgi:hypothetical protein